MYGLHFYVSQKTAHLEKAGPASGRWSQAPKYGLKYPFTFKESLWEKSWKFTGQNVWELQLLLIL